MRDNWMSHPEFSGGDAVFAISHTMLVDRIQYLPGNQIEGNQTLMVRAILDDDASTNLVVHVSMNRPRDELVPAIKETGIPFSYVGDAISPRFLVAAIASGNAAGRTI